jgi:hypothetical protein
VVIVQGELHHGGRHVHAAVGPHTAENGRHLAELEMRPLYARGDDTRRADAGEGTTGGYEGSTLVRKEVGERPLMDRVDGVGVRFG